MGAGAKLDVNAIVTSMVPDLVATAEPESALLESALAAEVPTEGEAGATEDADDAATAEAAAAEAAAAEAAAAEAVTADVDFPPLDSGAPTATTPVVEASSQLASGYPAASAAAPVDATGFSAPAP